MKTTSIYLFVAITLVFHGCIGTDILDDEVPATIRITTLPDSIAVGDSFQFEATFFNTVGQAEQVLIEWESEDPDILEINDNGLSRALSKGSTLVSAIAPGKSLRAEHRINVGDTTIVPPAATRSGTIRTTSSYQLQGTFEVSEDAGDLLIEIGNDYRASTALPGLYLYLTNNPNSISGALELGPVETFSGAHSYRIPGVSISSYSHLLYYCKPFSVKVGDGKFEN